MISNSMIVCDIEHNVDGAGTRGVYMYIPSFYVVWPFGRCRDSLFEELLNICLRDEATVMWRLPY